MWEISKVSNSVGIIPRLRLFTYEPSYYSLLLAPILLFNFSEFQKIKSKPNLYSILLLVLSFLLSFSFGVISAIIISLLIVYGIRIKNLISPERRDFILFILFIVIVSLFILYLILPENILFRRLYDIISGNDTSARGRITEPWHLAHMMLAKHGDYLFGIGWGQIRTIGSDIIREFYEYQHSPEHKFGLPNVLTEIMAMFGYIGLFVVITTQLVLYNITRVKNSDFRSLIFWFIFVYQFTGSYSSSVLYYAFFVLAFSKSLDELMIDKLNPNEYSD